MYNISEKAFWAFRSWRDFLCHNKSISPFSVLCYEVQLLLSRSISNEMVKARLHNDYSPLLTIFFMNQSQEYA